MSILLELKGASKRYDNGTLALQDVDLAIGEREFVSFLGPSGCGKSTALRMIAGLSPITSGQITWPSVPPSVSGQARTSNNSSQEHGKDISFVFQEPTLMPWTKVFDNVWLPLKLKGVGRAAAQPQVDAVLATVGLSQFANVYPRELSGGMKMRVSIARAMITEPRLLLMDEPFAALDDITRQKLNTDLLQWWQGRAMAALFVTHSVTEAVFLSQRVLVMAARPGRVVAEVLVKQPYPRSAEFRDSSAFVEACRAVAAALADAHAAQPATAATVGQAGHAAHGPPESAAQRPPAVGRR